MALKGSFGGRVVVDPAKVATMLRSDQAGVVRYMMERGQRVKAGAQRRVGVHTPDPLGRPSARPPGQLRDSIVTRLVAASNVLGFVVQVGSEDEIALIHHEGTEPHEIRAKRARVLVFAGRGGGVVRVPTVQHPGTRPNRYLADALNDLST